MVFNPDYEYIVDGFFVNGTSYKDTVVVRRLQHVFFEADPSLRLSYSVEIYNLADPLQVTFFVGDVDELASQIAATLISSGAAAALQRPYSLHDFLSQHWPQPLPTYYGANNFFDLCCATFLTGDTTQARGGFRVAKQRWDEYVAEHGEPRDAYGGDRRREVDEIAALLEGSDADLRQHILEAVARNASLLGFPAVGRGNGGVASGSPATSQLAALPCARRATPP